MTAERFVGARPPPAAARPAADPVGAARRDGGLGAPAVARRWLRRRDDRRRIAILGSGAVGGLLGAALGARRRRRPRSSAREETARGCCARRAARSHSRASATTRCGVRAVDRLTSRSTRWSSPSRPRPGRPRWSASRSSRGVVVPLLNGVEHLARAARALRPDRVVRGRHPRRGRPRGPGARRAPSPFLRVDIAPARRAGARRTLLRARRASTTKVGGAEAEVMWRKLARLAALALDDHRGRRAAGRGARATPRPSRARSSPVARAEGADVDADAIVAELRGLPDAAVVARWRRRRRRPRARARRDRRRGPARRRAPRPRRADAIAALVRARRRR